MLLADQDANSKYLGRMHFFRKNKSNLKKKMYLCH